MFAESIAIAAQFTRPVIISKRLHDQTISSGMATFVVVNDAGWVLTCAHVVQDILTAQQHAPEIAEYRKALDGINANPLFSNGKKKHEIGRLKANNEWITNSSYWWAINGISFARVQADPLTDLALVQLAGPLEALNVKKYPIFANPATPIKQGTSLCRLGFPFHEVNAIFDNTAGRFKLDLPVLATFPNDGIMTRNVVAVDPISKRQIQLLETSTAGLRGQSGGPIFDTKGNVWAIQSKTTSFPLGFSPVAKVGGKDVVEHQFMHCGLGVHVLHIREMLEKTNVAYQSA